MVVCPQEASYILETQFKWKHLLDYRFTVLETEPDYFFIY